MSDQTPFVPPGGPPPAVPPAYVSPSPYGPPPSIQPTSMPPAVPKPPPDKKVRAVVIVAIVTGSVLVLGLLVGGVVAASNFIVESIGENGTGLGGFVAEDPLVTGDEASPVAVEPMECGGCFTDDDLSSTVIEQSELDAVGLISTLEPWSDYTSTYDVEATYFRKSWRDVGGDPADCFVTYPAAPLSILEPGDIKNDGSQIAYTGTYADDGEWSTMGQSVRIFDEDQEAVDYMAGLADAIGGCTHYQSGEGETYWEADVTLAPALNLPPSVAGIGWVETTEYYTRYYSFDLQRGNIVVRTGMWTAEEISELEFRALVEHVAVQLAEITPAPAPAG